MATNPQLSQSTAIAKSTATDDRLSALVPSLTTEESPVRIYMPGITSAVDSLIGSAGSWLCPDGVTSVQVEAWGAGGAGGGGSPDPAGIPIRVASTTLVSVTTATLTIPSSFTVNPSANGIIYVVARMNNSTAQTPAVTDSKGNTYSTLRSTAANNESQYTFISGATTVPLKNGDTISLTTSVSAGSMTVTAYWIPAATAAGATGIQNLNGTAVSVTANTVAASTNLNIITITGSNPGLASVPAGWTVDRRVLDTMTSVLTLYKLTDQGSLVTGTFTATMGVTGAYEVVSSVFTVAAPAQQFSGGGGGGAGEYVCEPSYPVTPGEVYSYFAGQLGAEAPKGIDGGDGGASYFDFRGEGLQGGVVANGGSGGGADGTGGQGGTGSSNSVNFDGGTGGTTTSGVGSDNPVAVFGSSASMWWDFGNPAGVFDISGHGRDGSVVAHPGGIIGPVNAADKPVQIPSEAGSPQTVERFSKGTSTDIAGGIGAHTFGGVNTLHFTLSCWVKGDGSVNWGGNRTVLAQTMDISGFVDGNSPASTDKGYAFFIDYTQNNLLRFVTKNSGTVNYSSAQFAMGASLSSTIAHPQDGKWHQFAVAYDQPNNAIRIFVDGVQRGSTFTVNSANTSVPVGNLGVTVGENYKTGWQGFSGYMSNLWIASLTATPAQMQAFYGLSSSTGGSGGGAAGGSAGAGTAGNSSLGATGGTGGAGALPVDSTHGSSQAGSAGGNNGLNGSAVNSPTVGSSYAGAAGGGAGAVSYTLPTGSTTIPAARSASYVGPDPDGGTPGAMYSVSDSVMPGDTSNMTANPTVAANNPLCYAGGKAESPALGTMATVVQFPDQSTTLTDNGVNRLTDVYPYRLTLNLTVNTPNAAALQWALVAPNAIPAAIDFTTNPSSTFGTALPAMNSTVFIPAGDAGRRVSIPIITFDTNIGWAQLTAKGGAALVFGSVFDYANLGYASRFNQYYNEPAAEDWYCEFYGAGTDDGDNDMSLTVDYAYANPGPQVYSGNGGNGRIQVSYVNAEGTPVTTILPSASTDTSGNALGAGVTTDQIQTWQPGTSPLALETWHTLTPVNGAAGNPPSTNVLRYKRLPGNMVMLQMTLIYASGNYVTLNANIASLPPLYAPSKQVEFAAGTYVQSGTQHGVRCSISTGGVIGVSDGGLTVSEVHACVIFPLD